MNTTHSNRFTLERIILQQSVLIEDIRVLRNYFDEQLAYFKLDTDKQFKALGKEIALVLQQLHAIRQNLDTVLRNH